MFQALSSYYNYGKAILFKTLPFAKQPHTVTVQQVSAALDILKENRLDRNTEIRDFLETCKTDEILLVTDLQGYNILQRAITVNNQELIHYIIRRGCDLNTADCSLPLHLAAYLGQEGNVHLLLNHGAKPEGMSGMCYPNSHHNDNWMATKFFFINKNLQSCYSNKHLAVYYAIKADHEKVASALMEAHCVPSDNLFLLACLCGAFKCMQLFNGDSIVKDTINKTDDLGMTPIHHASKWGLKFLKSVSDLGGSMTALTTKKHQTLLHLIYADGQRPLELFDMTRYLLGSGLEQYVNHQDCHGNTALHLLVQLVNKNIKNYTCFTNDECSLEKQKQFQYQIVNCLSLLLNHNCDPFVQDEFQRTPLSTMLQTMRHTMLSPLGIRFNTDSYIFDIDMICDTLKAYLSHTNSVMMSSQALLTILHLLTQILDIHLALSASSFLHCLVSLCTLGANPNMLVSDVKPAMCLIVDMAHGCFDYGSDKEEIAVFVNNILTLMLTHGLDPNIVSENPKEKPEMARNGLTQFVQLVKYIREPRDIQIIHKWVLTLLQHGANPNLQPYISEPIICHSQSSIFLKQRHTQPINQYMDQIQDYRVYFEGGHAEAMLMLFYSSMDHDCLYQCLNNAKYITRFTSEKMPSAAFNQILSKLTSNPRSLQDISRLAIYKALDRQLMHKIHKLPLPTRMKDYLLNIQ